MCYKRSYIIIHIFPGNCQHGVPETVSTLELAWFGLLPSRDGDQRAIRLSLAQGVLIDDVFDSNDGDDVNDDVDGDYPHSDPILVSLRAPGETGYKIPHGGLFCLLSAPNYFGETMEWCGFAAFAQVKFSFAWFLAGFMYCLGINYLWHILPEQTILDANYH